MKRISALLSTSRVLFIGLLVAGNLSAQPYPNPYRIEEGWAKLPDGRAMGPVGDVDIDPDGEHIWAIVRCGDQEGQGGHECLNSELDPILKFNQSGEVVESFGAGMFIWPHGLEIDQAGNVWVAESVASKNLPPGDSRAHQVVKFSPTGEVLMVLGNPGVEGKGPHTFNRPSDVVVAPNGDIFIADGHDVDTNNRIVKYDADGTYLMEWGQTGYGPGEFRMLHALAIDQRGRLFVADRFNNRVQIFDQEGNFLANGLNLADPAGFSLMRMIRSMSLTRNQTISRIRGGKWVFALVMRKKVGCTILSPCWSVIPEKRKAVEPSSSRSTNTATCMEANPACARYANTSACVVEW